MKKGFLVKTMFYALTIIHFCGIMWASRKHASKRAKNHVTHRWLIQQESITEHKRSAKQLTRAWRTLCECNPWFHIDSSPDTYIQELCGEGWTSQSQYEAFQRLLDIRQRIDRDDMSHIIRALNQALLQDTSFKAIHHANLEKKFTRMWKALLSYERQMDLADACHETRTSQMYLTLYKMTWKSIKKLVFTTSMTVQRADVLSLQATYER